MSMSSAAQRAGTVSLHFVASPRELTTVAPPYVAISQLDGALERIARARWSIASRAEHSRMLQAAAAIVDELREGLDPEVGGAMAANLDDLYDYIRRQLVAASLQNRTAALDEVSDLLREIRSTWTLLPPEVRATREAASRR